MINQNDLEEGEAHARSFFLGDTNTDPDVAFSHIDRRLHAVLGHFQKEFEGGVSADKLARAEATPLNSNATRPSRELKLKLKQSSESLKRVRNSAIYCELGLQNSSTSSSESSSIDSQSSLLEYDAVSKQSPMTIVMMMTEYKIPGGSLLSPIPESPLKFIEVLQKTKVIVKLGKRKKTDNSEASFSGHNIRQQNASAKCSNEDKLDSQKRVKKIKSDSLAYDGKNTHNTKSHQDMHVDRCHDYMHVRKDVDDMPTSSFSNSGNMVLREATSLKHVADRLRNGEESIMEFTHLYFEAALKYLLAASIFEAGKFGTMKTRELSYAMKIYTDTAQLFKYCAFQFEQLRNMAATALAYKCMAVAYMRVVHSQTTFFTRDPVGLEPLLHSVVIGNLSNAHIRACLQYANDVMAGMDAFSKSEQAFAVAVKEAHVSERSEQISAVKMVIDFSFEDIGSFLQLAWHAMVTLHH